MVEIHVIGDATVGSPYWLRDMEFLTGTVLYPTFQNVAEFNHTIESLNKFAIAFIRARREKNPNLRRGDIRIVTGQGDGANEIVRLWATKNGLQVLTLPEANRDIALEAKRLILIGDSLELSELAELARDGGTAVKRIRMPKKDLRRK